MSSQKMMLIFALSLLTACADRDLVAPDEEGAVIQAAKGGVKGPPDDGGDDESPFTITTTDLGTLPGRSASLARSIVSAPVRVVGWSSPFDGAFYWTSGSMMELTGPAAEQGSSFLGTGADDINEAGEIVGRHFVIRSDPGSNGLQPLFWSSRDAVAIVLPLGPARSSFATAINNYGQVVGQSFDHTGDPSGPHAHAMLWTIKNGGVAIQDLHGDFENQFLNSLAEDINDGGQVVGRAYDGDRERAFLWNDGVVTILDDDVDPIFSTFAMAINDAPNVQIVGFEQDLSGGSPGRALLWTVEDDGTVSTQALPLLAGFGHGSPRDLNDLGEVVGGASPANGKGDGHAILWTVQTGQVRAVDLGAGEAQGVDNPASLGLTHVVGFTAIRSGKGRNSTVTNRALLWKVEPKQ